MNKRAWQLVPFLIAALGVALWPTTARMQDDFDAYRERFEGTWRLAGSVEAAERARDQAAERAASAMNLFIRGIAASRLREGSHVNRRIRLSFEDGRRIGVEFDNGRYRSPVGRTVRVQREDGTPMRLTHRFRSDGSLEQVFQTDSGTRWYVYVPTGPDTLRLETTTDSDRMPQPMHLSLDYRRE